MKPTLLILAAGMGTRYGGLKQLDRVGPSGEAIIDYSIYDAIRAGFGKVVFVIRKELEQEFVPLFAGRLAGRVRIEFVTQELQTVPAGVQVPPARRKPWGTAHAVLVAASHVNEPFAVINADDFYGAEAYRAVAGFLAMSPARSVDKYCVVGYQLARTLSDFGAVSRGVCEVDEQGHLVSVIERTHIERQKGGIFFADASGRMNPLTGKEMVSTNMWGFRPSVFKHLQYYFKQFLADETGSTTAEFYLPVVINRLVSSAKIQVVVLPGGENWFGVTYKADQPRAVAMINELVADGRYPENLWQ